jgi:hypothetical protein
VFTKKTKRVDFPGKQTDGCEFDGGISRKIQGVEQCVRNWGGRSGQWFRRPGLRGKY